MDGVHEWGAMGWDGIAVVLREGSDGWVVVVLAEGGGVGDPEDVKREG